MPRAPSASKNRALVVQSWHNTSGKFAYQCDRTLRYSSLLMAPLYSHPFGWTVKRTVLARSGSSGGDLCSEGAESGLGFSMVRLGPRGLTVAEGAVALSHASWRRFRSGKN